MGQIVHCGSRLEVLFAETDEAGNAIPKSYVFALNRLDEESFAELRCLVERQRMELAMSAEMREAPAVPDIVGMVRDFMIPDIIKTEDDVPANGGMPEGVTG